MDEQSEKKMEELTVYWMKAQPAVAAFITSVVRNFQQADDILQLVAVEIVKKFDQYDKSRPFIPWAIGIAKYKILSDLSKTRAGKLIFDTEAVEEIAGGYESEYEIFDDIRKALDYCIQKLKNKSRQIIEMRYCYDLKPSKIASYMGMTVNSVFVTLHRTRLALRKCIEQQLGAKGELL